MLNTFLRKLRGGGGQGGLNLPLRVPFNPGSRPVFFDSRPFAFIRLRNIAQFCVIFSLFLPLPATLGIPLPAPSSPASRTPPAPFSPGLPPPCPAPQSCFFGKFRNLVKDQILLVFLTGNAVKREIFCTFVSKITFLIVQYFGVRYRSTHKRVQLLKFSERRVM